MRQLQEALAIERAASAELEARYAALRQEHRALQQTLATTQRALTQARATGRQLLEAAWTQVDVWRRLACAADRRQEPSSPAPTLEPTLKRLLALCHPDRWAQAQPASALAHELTVLINHVRSHGETLP